MASITHTATFKPGDSVEKMLDDLCCPICRHYDLGTAFSRIADGKLGIFCDCCATFITISVTPEQEDALVAWLEK